MRKRPVNKALKCNGKLRRYLKNFDVEGLPLISKYMHQTQTIGETCRYLNTAKKYYPPLRHSASTADHSCLTPPLLMKDQINSSQWALALMTEFEFTCILHFYFSLFIFVNYVK